MRSVRAFLPLIACLILGATGCGIDLIESIFPDNSKPDLRLVLPEGSSTGPGPFCRAGPTALVTVENRGDADAGTSITTFVFVPGGSVDVQTPEIRKDESVQLSAVAVPAACFAPDCRFAILADASFRVDESDENNNRAEGQCPASAAPPR